MLKFTSLFLMSANLVLSSDLPESASGAPRLTRTSSKQELEYRLQNHILSDTGPEDKMKKTPSKRDLFLAMGFDEEGNAIVRGPQKSTAPAPVSPGSNRVHFDQGGQGTPDAATTGETTVEADTPSAAGSTSPKQGIIKRLFHRKHIGSDSKKK